MMLTRAVLLLSVIVTLAVNSRAAAQPSSANIVKDCDGCPELVAVDIETAVGKRRYYIGRFEVTYKDYIESVIGNGCKLRDIAEKIVEDTGGYEAISDDVAMTYVTDEDIDCYLAYLSRKTGHRYRLPTLDEWRWAGWQGKQSRYPWGDVLEPGHVRMENESSNPPADRRHMLAGRKVGSFPPNALGLYDVIGNVREVLADRSDSTLKYPDGRIWYRRPAVGGALRSYAATPYVPDTYILDGQALPSTGFRVVRD